MSEKISGELLESKEYIGKLKKELKFKEHDIYFLKKDNANLNAKNKILEQNQNNIIEFSKKYKIKDIIELLEFIENYKEKCNLENEIKKCKINNKNIIYLIMNFIVFCIYSKLKKLKNNNIHKNIPILPKIKIIDFKIFNKEENNQKIIKYKYLPYNIFLDIVELIEKRKYLYVQDIVNQSININSLYNILNEINNRSLLYDIVKKDNKINKNNNYINSSREYSRKPRKPKKNNTEKDYEIIIEKTINNILYFRENNKLKEHVIEKLYDNNREIINKYIEYYDLYVNGDINREEYKNISLGLFFLIM